MPRVNQPKRNAPRGPRGVADRPSAMVLLLRRQRRLLRPAAYTACGVAMIGALALLARQANPGASLDTMRTRFGRLVNWPVTEVVVEGRVNTPEPLLDAALGVRKGEPIFGFSVEGARQRIETLSWVQHVAVERRLPGTIVVSLDEKRPFAIWQNQGRFQLIDRNGAVVTNEDIGGFGKLPLVVGVGAPQNAAALLDALARQPALQGRVVAAVRVGERRWNLHLNNGIDVLLPEGAEQAAIERLMVLQQSEDLLDRKLSVIDMRLPDRLVLRPQPEPHPDAHPGTAPSGRST